MQLTFDPAKNAANIAQRGISFTLLEQMDWDAAQVAQDTRTAYGEPRFQVTGPIAGRLHVAIITPREAGLRVISLRKANAREQKRYEKAAY